MSGETKIVPCEPTEAMLDAAQRAWTPGVSHYEAHAIRYRAMLAASPPAETGEGESEVERLKGKLRNVVSHATGGNCLEGDDLSLNEISVRITQFRNKLYEAGKQSAQPVSPSEGAAVRWIVKARFICKPGYKSGGGVTIEVDTQTKADSEKARLEALKNVETVTVTPLYTHPASDQSDTERMRAEQHRVGDPVTISKAYRYSEWHGEPLFVCGVNATNGYGEITYNLSENWPPKGHGDCTTDFPTEFIIPRAALAEKAADK